MLVLTSKENINLSWYILVEFGLLNIIYLFHISVDTVLRMGGLKLWGTRWNSGEGSWAKAPLQRVTIADHVDVLTCHPSHVKHQFDASLQNKTSTGQKSDTLSLKSSDGCLSRLNSTCIY